jgi:hypothetical protein
LIPSSECRKAETANQAEYLKARIHDAVASGGLGL